MAPRGVLLVKAMAWLFFFYYARIVVGSNEDVEMWYKACMGVAAAGAILLYIVLLLAELFGQVSRWIRHFLCPSWTAVFGLFGVCFVLDLQGLLFLQGLAAASILGTSIPGDKNEASLLQSVLFDSSKCIATERMLQSSGPALPPNRPWALDRNRPRSKVKASPAGAP